MKRFLLLFLSLLMVGMAYAQDAKDDEDDADSATLKYIGVNGCKKCHKTEKQGNQFGIWSESAHAKAFETLKSPEAVKIAKEKGIAKAPHEAAECLKCHVTGNDKPAEMMSARFSVEDGVQCETCHGAGSMYKKKTIMKDREQSIANGMTAISVKDGSAEKQCRTCHNEESPTFKEFNFEEMWKKIAHPVPAE